VIVAGLTGGIATGKSTVAGIFASAGAVVVDADRIARDAVRPGTAVHADIVAHFGSGILLADGALDRKQLAAIIFGDPAEQRTLERMVHPQVKRQVAMQLNRLRREAPEAVVVVDVPLLFETGMDRGLPATILVYAPEAIQMRRLIARDGLSKAGARARIRAQMPIEAKKALAAIVIDNSGPLESTRRQTLAVYRRLVREQGEMKKGSGVQGSGGKG
jgi:dephospho-CoA kinase